MQSDASGAVGQSVPHELVEPALPAPMFWLWFAVNSSVVSVVLGGVLLSLGMSLRQTIVATLAGIAVSCVPLGLGTLAGKLSGQPTMVVSRASFGHFGNILPASLALLTRVFLGGVLLWFLAVGITRILLEARLQGPFAETQLMILTFAIGFLLALVIAFFGYGLIARVQLAISVVSAIALIGLIVVPAWFLVPLMVALARSLLSGVVVSNYSGGFAVQALGAPVRRPIALVVVSIMVAILTILLIVSVGDFTLMLRDVATTLAVPVTAWVGIFAWEMMIRVRRFDSRSLLQRGGNHADFRWLNVGAFLSISVIGFGLTTASVIWLTWQGYLFWLFGVRADSHLGSTDLGVLVTFLLGILTPLVAGIPAIRRQERPIPVGN